VLVVFPSQPTKKTKIHFSFTLLFCFAIWNLLQKITLNQVALGAIQPQKTYLKFGSYFLKQIIENFPQTRHVA
jgi:hypothetical protein